MFGTEVVRQSQNYTQTQAEIVKQCETFLKVDKEIKDGAYSLRATPRPQAKHIYSNKQS